MLTELDTRQRALLDQVRAEWADVLLCTEPADRPAAEAAVRGAYELADLTPPERMVWVSSPLVGALALTALSVMGEPPDQVTKEHALWTSLLSQHTLLAAMARLDEVDREVLAAVRGAPVRMGSIEYHFAEWEDREYQGPGTPLFRHLQDQVEAVKGAPGTTPGRRLEADAVTEEIMARTLAVVEPLLGPVAWDEVVGRLRERIRELPYTREVKEHVTVTKGYQVDGQWHPYGATRAASLGPSGPILRGQFVAYRWGFVDFFHRAGLTGLERVAPLLRGLSACGPWWPLPDLVLLSERPQVLRFDADRQLHADRGPAVAYDDGYAVYATHGTLRPPGQR